MDRSSSRESRRKIPLNICQKNLFFLCHSVCYKGFCSLCVVFQVRYHYVRIDDNAYLPFTRNLIWVSQSAIGASWAMGQKDSKPSHSYSYDYGNTSSGYNSRYAANTSSSYSARYAPSSENTVQPETHARLQRKYSRIGDDYRTLNQVMSSRHGHAVY
jgi:hypothetical protein